MRSKATTSSASTHSGRWRRRSKAVLVGSEVPIPYTHDLGFLLDILSEHAITASSSVANADWLTPLAVAARYGASDATLDREAAVLVADEAVTWAGATIDGVA